jgi:hypothetical protein
MLAPGYEAPRSRVEVVRAARDDVSVAQRRHPRQDLAAPGDRPSTLGPAHQLALAPDDVQIAPLHDRETGRTSGDHVPACDWPVEVDQADKTAHSQPSAVRPHPFSGQLFFGIREGEGVARRPRCPRTASRFRSSSPNTPPTTTSGHLGPAAGKRLGGRLRGPDERLDVDDLGPEVLERGAGLEVAVLGLVRYPGMGAAMLFYRGSLARRCANTGGPLLRPCLAPTAALPCSGGTFLYGTSNAESQSECAQTCLICRSSNHDRNGNH